MTKAEYQRQYRARPGMKTQISLYSRKHRDNYLQRINVLKDRPCLVCRDKFLPECMDFDHVRGRKLFEISAGWKRPWRDVQREIKKCDLICANCHRTRTKRGRTL